MIGLGPGTARGVLHGVVKGGPRPRLVEDSWGFIHSASNAFETLAVVGGDDGVQIKNSSNSAPFDRSKRT